MGGDNLFGAAGTGSCTSIGGCKETGVEGVASGSSTGGGSSRLFPAAPAGAPLPGGEN